jgi:hypothetical protein
MNAVDRFLHIGAICLTLRSGRDRAFVNHSIAKLGHAYVRAIQLPNGRAKASAIIKVVGGKAIKLLGGDPDDEGGIG